MPATARRTGSRSADTVLARATAIYAILTEGDLSRGELINAVIRRLGPEVYGTAPEDSLRHDLDQLVRLGFEVKILPGHLYHLEHVAPRFPLPLTREHVSTLAAMRRAMSGTVYGDAVEELVARMRPFVPAKLQPLLDREPLVQRLLAEVSRAIALCLVLALPVVFRLACAGAALAGAMYAGPRVWLAFGADAVALFPAAAVVLLPLAATQGARLSWGGLVMAGALTAGIGLVVGLAGDLLRALLVIATLATVVYHLQTAHEGGTTSQLPPARSGWLVSALPGRGLRPGARRVAD